MKIVPWIQNKFCKYIYGVMPVGRKLFEGRISSVSDHFCRSACVTVEQV
jgi:hypothetical protein